MARLPLYPDRAKIGPIVNDQDGTDPRNPESERTDKTEHLHKKSEAQRHQRSSSTRSLQGTDDNSDKVEKEKYLVYRIHTKIVDGWFERSQGSKVNLEDEEYKRVLLKTDSEGRNLIQRTTLKLCKKQRDGATLFPKEALDCIEQLVLEKPELFTESDENYPAPMVHPLKHDISLLLRVMKLLIPTEVVERLEAVKTRCVVGREASCPLWDVSKARLKQCSKEKDRRAEAAAANLGLENDDEAGKGRRCLHDEINAAKVMEENNKLKSNLQAALENDAYKDCLQPLLTPKNFDEGQKDKRQMICVDTFKAILGLCPDTVFNKLSASHTTPLQLAVKLYEEQSIKYDLLFSVIEALIERYPRSIFLKPIVDGHAKTAYSQLRMIGERKTMNAISDAEELFKRTCIGFQKKEYQQHQNVVMEDIEWIDVKRNFLYSSPRSRKSPQLLRSMKNQGNL